MIALASSALAFSTPPTPMRNFRPSFASPAVAAYPTFGAISLASMPLPAFADDGFDIVGGIVNLVLTAAVLGFFAFISSYVLEAVGTVGEQVGKIAEYDAAQPKGGPKRSSEPVFDDSGSGAVSEAQIQAELVNRKKRGKGSLQKSASGVSFAPWMDIDEDAIEKMKQERRQRKK